MREAYGENVVALGADAVYFLPFLPLPGTPLGTSDGEPDPAMVEEAARLTKAFEDHPVVRMRMDTLAREPTVRGMLARASIRRRASEGERQS